MMKFFALVALTVFATTNASSVADGVITRGSTLLTGADGGNLIITFKAGTGTIVSGDTVKFTPVENAGTFFTTDDADCSCTATPAAITGVVGKPVKSTGVLSMVLTTSSTIAATTEVVITCTANLAVNAAAGAKTFKLETTKDSTEVTATGYITTTGVTSFSATRGTSYLTLAAPGTLVFGFTPTNQVELSGVITLTSNVALYDANAVISCSATYADIAVAVPTFVAATTKADATGKILTLTLEGAATDILPATKAATITCLATNMAVNTAGGDVKFTVGTTTDVGPTVEETGYTILAGFKDFTATRASLVTGVAPGNLVVTLTPLILIGNSGAATAGTITLTPSKQFFDGNTAGGTATTCTVVTDPVTGAVPELTAAVTGHDTTAQVLTLSMGSKATDTIAVDEVATITCTGNMDVVNGAAASVVTFGVKTSGDATGLAAQAGYTIDAATSAASAGAGVSMLTMLALAGVAMRQ